MRNLTAEQANAIYDVLVQHAGASEEGRDAFVVVQVNTSPDEFRFGGALGFGGKFWHDRDGWRVSAYAEDARRWPEMRDVIDVTNAALATLRAKETTP